MTTRADCSSDVEGGAKKVAAPKRRAAAKKEAAPKKQASSNASPKKEAAPRKATPGKDAAPKKDGASPEVDGDGAEGEVKARATWADLSSDVEDEAAMSKDAEPANGMEQDAEPANGLLFTEAEEKLMRDLVHAARRQHGGGRPVSPERMRKATACLEFVHARQRRSERCSE